GQPQGRLDGRPCLEPTGLEKFLNRRLQAADSQTGNPRLFRLPRPIDGHKEVTHMTISVLDALIASEVTDANELPCRANDPELFFAESPADVELAKALCRSCPVRADCLSGAIDRHEPWGAW